MHWDKQEKMLDILDGFDTDTLSSAREHSSKTCQGDSGPGILFEIKKLRQIHITLNDEYYRMLSVLVLPSNKLGYAYNCNSPLAHFHHRGDDFRATLNSSRINVVIELQLLIIQNRRELHIRLAQC